MKEDKILKQEVDNFNGQVKRLKNQQTINEMFKERTKTQETRDRKNFPQGNHKGENSATSLEIE